MVQWQNRDWISLFTYTIEDIVPGTGSIICTQQEILGEIAFDVVVPYQGCDRLRKIREKISSSLTFSAKLDGPTDSNEFCIKVWRKGRL